MKIGIDYVHIPEFERNEYCSAVASRVEAQKLIAVGFEYICSHKDITLQKKKTDARYISSHVA